jgi:hypothetical protein
VRQAFLVVVAAVALAATGCGGGNKSAATTVTKTVTQIPTTTNPTGTASVKTHGRYHYPPQLVRSYMQSCTKGDTSKRAYCGCTLDKLSNNVSVGDFVRVGLAGGKLPPRIRRLITKAATACADKL